MHATRLSVFANGGLLADRVVHATRFSQRLRGLLATRSLPHGAGLLLEPGGSVHTLGMRFAIDVVFLDRHGIVLDTRSNLVPNRACRAPWRTRSTLELWAGACDDVILQTGQRLIFTASNHDAPSQ